MGSVQPGRSLQKTGVLGSWFNTMPNSRSLLTLAKGFNNFYLSGLGSGECLPLLCSSVQVGFVPAPVVTQLQKYPNVFTVSKAAVTINEVLKSPEERNKALETVLLDLKKQNMFEALRGWRDECYDIKEHFSSTALFKMERSATPLFGLRQYGIHINGFVRHSTRGECLWLQRRSPTKQTYPGLLDSLVGGGLAAGMTVGETVVKEAMEEANVPEALAAKATSAGSVSFFYRSERGFFPNTEFVFDLELPESFQPGNNDGEVSGFQLTPVEDIVSIITSQDYKITSAPIALDWLVRHGHVTLEEEPDLPEIVELLHLPLHFLYQS